MTKILLKNGEIVSSKGTKIADVLMEDGKIAMVEEGIIGDFEEIDCSGKMILPGLIDAHVHFREPGSEYKEDFESGSRAAVAGGVTTILDMPNNNPAIVDKKSLDLKREIVEGRSYCNYGFFLGYNGKNLKEIAKVKNVAGVKVYAANSTGDMGVSNEDLEKLVEETNKQIVVHAEDESLFKKVAGEDPAIHSEIRNAESEVSAIKFCCELAKKYSKKIHIAHLSTKDGLELITKHRKYGVTCEVAPHHLTLSTDDYESLANLIKMNPPVRDKEDLFALWVGLKYDRIDIIATDHAPHPLEEKERSYADAPSGVPGIETLLPIFLNVVNDEGMEIEEVVKLCCERPAELYGIKNKGRIEVGYDADLVVVDMDLEKKVSNEDLLTKCGWSPYNGMMYKGWPIMTFVNGVVGELNGKEIEF
jgi:dihydroorotase